MAVFPSQLLLLDSFKRVESGLGSNEPWKTKWSVLEVNKETGTNAPTIGTISEESYQSQKSFAEGQCAALWEPTSYTETSIAATVQHLHGLSERFFALYARVAKVGAGKFNGYRLLVEEEGTALFKLKLQKFKESEAFAAVGVEKTGISIPVGAAFGFSIQGNKLSAWKKSATGSWEEVIAPTEDTTYTSGFVGCGARGNVGHFQNLEAVEGRTQDLQIHGGPLALPQLIGFG